MRVVVITAPDPVVSYAEAVARLKLAGGGAEQADIEAMIAAATRLFDAPRGFLGRAIGEQTLELRCDNLVDDYGDPLKLPFPPIAAIISVKYLDDGGVEQTLPGGDYELIGEELWPTPDASWPTPMARREAVRIRYSAGYDDVPENVAGAILLAVGDMYRFRETIGVQKYEELPSAGSIANLLAGEMDYS